MISKTGVFIYILTLVLIVMVAFIIYMLITREMHKRVKVQEERLKILSQTEEGKKQIEQECIKRDNQYKRSQPFIHVGFIVSYFAIFITGLSGVYIFINDIRSGKRLMEIVFAYNGYYIVSPLVLVYSIIKLASCIRQNKYNE